MPRPTILVSAFGPWGALPHNPTLAVLERLGDRALPGRLVPLPLAVDSAAVEAAIGQALDTHRPDLWIGLGLALGASVIAVERLAANLLDFAEPDLLGARPAGRPVVPGGPAAYATTLPVTGTVAALRAAGVPARASLSAGAFLCNQLLYTVLHAIERTGLPTRAGFLHVPADPALVAVLPGRGGEHPSMSLDLMVRAVVVAAETALAAPSRLAEPNQNG